MKELNNDPDDSSRNAAQHIRISFDDNSWDKMENLLDKDDQKVVDSTIAGSKNANRSGKCNDKLLPLFLILLLTGATLFYIRKKL